MPATSQAPDTVVIGAGVIGCACAWRLAARGLKVALVDPHPGGGASGAAAGMLAPVTEAHFGEESLLALNLESARRYPRFVAELAEASGLDPGYRTTGTLVVARDLDDRAVLDELASYHRRLGSRIERLSGSEARALEPGLARNVRAGLLAPDDHQIDNRALLAALLAAGERAGVQLVRARAAGLELSGERVTGVVLAGERALAAGSVVLAAGCWSAQIRGLPPGWLPVRPVKGQLLHLRAGGQPELARRVIRGLRVYVVPRGDGRYVIGATVEEQGYDTAVTAGGVLDLLRHAYELLPGVTELELTETVAGLRPATPDNAPLIGRGPVDGLAIATGHYRNGVLLTPLTADVVAELVETGSLPPGLEPFTPDRASKLVGWRSS